MPVCICVYFVHPLYTFAKLCVCSSCMLVPCALRLGVHMSVCTCPFVLDQPSICSWTRVFAFLLLCPRHMMCCVHTCWAESVPVCCHMQRVCACVHACVRVCARVCVHVYMHVHVRTHTCVNGHGVRVFLSVAMTVLSVSQSSSALGLPPTVLACPTAHPSSDGLSHLRCPVTRATPASRPLACHLSWLNLGAYVRRPSQVPSHMGGCI